MSKKKIAPFLYQSYVVCPRQAWLHAKGVQMEHNSALVAEGRWIGENSYAERAKKNKELDLGIAKIDHWDAKSQIVREVKKSSKKEKAHLAQLRYYLYLLYQMGYPKAQGCIEYPLVRKTTYVEALSAEDIKQIEKELEELSMLLAQEKCPSRLAQKKCQNCSYFFFCWEDE